MEGWMMFSFAIGFWLLYMYSSQFWEKAEKEELIKEITERIRK